MCIWVSKINNTIGCKRTPLVGSEFCLYHKPEKSDSEAKLFWKIINWEWYNGLTGIEIQNILSNSYLNFSDEIRMQYQIKLNNAWISNFLPEEQNWPHFLQYKNFIDFELENNILWGIHGNYDFKGFVFPTYLYKSEFKFNHNPYKYYNGFGVIDFSEAKFECSILFDHYIFDRFVLFDFCEFKTIAGFYKTKFLNGVSFSNTSFSNVFRANIPVFQETNFNGREVKFEKTNPSLKGAIFGDYTSISLVDMSYSTKYGTSTDGLDSYRIAKIHSNKIGDFDKSAEYYFLEKKHIGRDILPPIEYWDHEKKRLEKFVLLRYIKENKRNFLPKFLDWMFYHTLGYGEKPGKALKTVVKIIFAFSLFYLFSGIKHDQSTINYDLYLGKDLINPNHFVEVIKDFGTTVYFSVVTFTTVGYGDFTPIDGCSKILSGIEMFLGVTFTGAWTATLLRKFMK